MFSYINIYFLVYIKKINNKIKLYQLKICFFLSLYNNTIYKYKDKDKYKYKDEARYLGTSFLVYITYYLF